MSDGDDADRTDRHAEISRRRALEAAGALGLTTTIAGCLGGGGGGGGTDTTTSVDTPQEGATGGDGTTSAGGTTTGTSGDGTSAGTTDTGTVTGTAVEPVYDLPGSGRGVPSQQHFNLYNPQQRGPRQFTWGKMAQTHYGLEDGLFYPELAESWNYNTDDNSFTINIRPDTTWWHNDEQVTSQDVWTTLVIEWRDREVLTGQTESLEMPDDKTIVLNLSGPTNQTLLEQQVLTRLVLPYSHYGDWAEDLQDLRFDQTETPAGTATTNEEAWSNYFSENISTATIEEAVGNGPFRITNATRQAYEAEPHEGHWAMDPWVNADAEGARLYFTGTQRVQQAAFSDEMDIFNGPPNDRLPDHFEQFTSPSTAGKGLGLNLNVAPLGKRNVRKALAHIINRQEVADAAAASGGGSKIVPEVITGISATQDTYIPEDMQSQYPAYSTDTERATTLLEEAGLSKQGGSWRLEDGSEWTPLITVMANNTSIVQAMNTVASQLSQFGIDTGLETVPNSQYFGELWTQNDFTMFAMYWGGWRPYPLNGLTASLYSHRHDNIGYPALQDNGGEIDAPMPIGEASGEMQTIDVEGLINELTASADRERNNEILRQLAWVYGTTLPEIPLYFGESSTMVASDGWNIPGSDSKHRNVKQPHFTLPRTGLLTPKTE